MSKTENITENKAIEISKEKLNSWINIFFVILINIQWMVSLYFIDNFIGYYEFIAALIVVFTYGLEMLVFYRAYKKLNEKEYLYLAFYIGIMALVIIYWWFGEIIGLGPVIRIII